jgi:hypothetical protein
MVSGVRMIQRTACGDSFDPELTSEGFSRVENGKQMTEDKGQTVPVFCHLLSDT